MNRATWFGSWSYGPWETGCRSQDGCNFVPKRYTFAHSSLRTTTPFLCPDHGTLSPVGLLTQDTEVKMYPQSASPTADHADPFTSSAGGPRRYVYSDNDSDNVDPYGRRDTYASDSSNNGLNDAERYYDHNGNYDSYGLWSTLLRYSHTHTCVIFKHNLTRTRMSTSMASGILQHPQNP